jgi:hypothetical protein
MKSLIDIIKEVETPIYWEERRGQRYWNRVAHAYEDTIGDKLTKLIGTDADPFYDDENIMRFLIAVNEALETHGSE